MRRSLHAVLDALLILPAPPAVAQQVAPVPGSPPALLIESRRWTGDFDGMVEWRRIRVLVPCSQTLDYSGK